MHPGWPITPVQKRSVATPFYFHGHPSRAGNRYDNMLVAQIYVDDIIFGATNQSLCEHFAKEMQSEFEMSIMGELTFFLGLQVKQSKDEIFINQAKYIKNMLKKFRIQEVREVRMCTKSYIKV